MNFNGIDLNEKCGDMLPALHIPSLIFNNPEIWIAHNNSFYKINIYYTMASSGSSITETLICNLFSKFLMDMNQNFYFKLMETFEVHDIIKDKVSVYSYLRLQYEMYKRIKCAL